MWHAQPIKLRVQHPTVYGKGVLRLSWRDYVKACRRMARLIAPFGYQDIYAIPRGGLIFGTIISHMLDIPMITADKVHSKTLIVDDLTDSGKALEPWVDKAGGAAVLFYKLHSTVQPTHFLKQTIRWVRFPYELKDK
jgi:hypoxanthine phosphoribosyltransferase